jgi:hypothetical protein
MTAINPARLKIQSAELAESFRNPTHLISELHNLLGFYSSRTRQSNLANSSLKLSSYQVPGPVIKALEQELGALLDQFPDEGLDLIDLIWQEEWLEFRHLAINLLYNMPTNQFKDIISRVQNWMDVCNSEELRYLIMEKGLSRLIREKPQPVLELVGELSKSGSLENQQAALFGLIPFAEDNQFDNLPYIFKNLRIILLKEENKLVKEICSVLRLLQKRADQETAYFLSKMLVAASKPRIIRITRHLMADFSPESQDLLRKGIKKYKEI